MIREISEVTRNFRDDRGCAPSGIRTWRAQHDACVDLPLVPDCSTARVADSSNEAVFVFCLLQNVLSETDEHNATFVKLAMSPSVHHRHADVHSNSVCRT
jgi:hypothetical protein